MKPGQEVTFASRGTGDCPQCGIEDVLLFVSSAEARARCRVCSGLADENTALFIEGWADGYTNDGQEEPFGVELRAALVNLARDIREGQHHV